MTNFHPLFRFHSFLYRDMLYKTLYRWIPPYYIMSNWKDPFDNDYNYPNPFRPGKPRNFITDLMKEMEDILKDLLNDESVNEKMNKMNRKATLKATVKRGNKVYNIIIDEVTPDASEIPDEIIIEWDKDGGFGDGHEDLKE